jgi:hypothetical protein
MTKFLDQTRERFLLAIAAELPAERFIELHFFQPIRQGGIESGVAVIAAYPESQPEIIVADAPPTDEPEEKQILRRSAPQEDNHSIIPSEASVIPSEASVIPSEASDLLLPSADDKGSVAWRAPLPLDDVRRYTVYSARYKLVLKGPDRGKWEFTMVAEADAPLVTVESVVRGVMRRSGDAEAPERMTGDEARDYVLAATRGSAA